MTLGDTAHEYSACGVARTKGAYQPRIAIFEIAAMFMKGDDRARRACIGVFIQNNRGFIEVHFFAENFLGDEVVHRQISLVEPHAF